MTGYIGVLANLEWDRNGRKGGAPCAAAPSLRYAIGFTEASTAAAIASVAAISVPARARSASIKASVYMHRSDNPCICAIRMRWRSIMAANLTFASSRFSLSSRLPRAARPIP